MVEHLVLLKWNAEARPERIEAALDGLRALKGQIPGILDLTCGHNFSDRAQGFHAGLLVRFTDRAALDAYLPHPAHQRVVQDLLNPIREETIALDYETD